jgi:hypothetical protein
MFVSNVRVAPSFDVGSGGMPFTCQAPGPNFALVGLVLRVGAWIDQVTPIFAEMLEDGALGPEIYGPSSGGHGGMVREVRCLPGYVVTGIQTRSGNYLDAIRLHQTRWDGSLVSSESHWTPWTGGLGGVERHERMAEPNGGGVVIGVAGRAGGYVDNLTIVTAELMKFSATAIVKGSARPTKTAAVG